jgi:hypothetical protein
VQSLDNLQGVGIIDIESALAPFSVLVGSGNGDVVVDVGKPPF